MMPRMAKPPFLVIDFDSTFVSVESLDLLAEISLARDSRREQRIAEIRDITRQGMEGIVPFEESLRRRLALLSADQSHIRKLVRLLKKSVTPSIARNKRFFSTHADSIYIISGGFREFIAPVVKSFGIAEDHVIANTFRFDRKGNVSGCDTRNPLAGKGGKTAAVKRLRLPGEIWVIGDGFTDYEIRKNGAANTFFAFTENVSREAVTRVADAVFPTFDEFLYSYRLPMAHSYPKSRLKILLLENIHPHALERFRGEGYSIEAVPGSLEEEELIRRVRGVAILCIRSKTEVTKRVLESADRLLAVGAFCIGTNQIDLPQCTRQGVAVFNAPYSNTRSVVELAIGEIIMLMRRASDKSARLHDGAWDKSAAGSFEIRGKKLGIVGYGNIGSQLSVAAESLGMRVYFHDVVEKLALGNAKRCGTLEELLRECDVVSLHVDGAPANESLIGRRELALMKRSAVLLNLSRGFVVDQEALAEALREGRLGGAGIDVFPAEPRGNGEPFSSPLQGLPNVILTPHIGGSTEEAQKSIGEFVSSKIADFMDSGNTYLSANLPNIQLPPLRGAHRFIHIHSNLPGVLASINGILAKHRLNIAGQYLKTNETVGYVITDVSRTYDRAVIAELRQVPHTLKFRVLY